MKQRLATGLFILCICTAPFVAEALWARGIARPLGYLAGVGLMCLGGLVVRCSGGFLFRA
jgi:hypothetical protein